MRVGVVDIGTNSTRLLIADVDDGRLHVLDRESIVTRLGQGVDASGELSTDATERVFATLADYRERLDRHETQRDVAVLTSAVRDASNGEQFLTQVRERFRLDARVLPGEEEARLTFLGATAERDPGDPTPVVVIDIGGGSTELVTTDFHVSTQAGVVRQTERHLRSDPPEHEELVALAADVRAIFAEAVPEPVKTSVRRAIAVAGTPTSLASIDLLLEPYGPERAHVHVLG